MKRISLTLLSATIGLLFLFLLTSILKLGFSTSALASITANSYEIIDLGTLGGLESQAEDVNDLGQIVGTSTLPGEIDSLAFIWEDGSMTPLPSPANMTTKGLAINVQGVAAGTAISNINESTTHWPILWANSTYTILETGSETQGLAADINDLGLIAGHSISDPENFLLLWDEATLSATIPFSGAVGIVNALNNSGSVVGRLGQDDDSGQAYIRDMDGFTLLGSLGGSMSSAQDINDSYQIVGSAAISDNLTYHAFLWDNGEMADLGALGDDPKVASQANGINDLGIAVGKVQVDEKEHAVMWAVGEMIDLNTLLPEGSEWELLTNAESINNKGWIVGTGILAGHKRGFLLRPEGAISKHYLPIIAAKDIPPTPTPSPTVTETPMASPTPTSTPIPPEAMDMAEFMMGDGNPYGRLYEVRHSSGSQARHQTQITVSRFFHTKGDEFKAEWEELWATEDFIYRGTDTSPGNDQYYSLYENNKLGSPWSPRYWKVGDLFERNPYVVFYQKANCSSIASGFQRSWLRFDAYYSSYTFATGLTLKDVVQFSWLLNPNGQPIEHYYYAKDFGLVGWGSNDRGYSAISEIHPPGQRLNNNREVIGCLNPLNQRLIPSPGLNLGRLPMPYALKVK